MQMSASTMRERLRGSRFSSQETEDIWYYETMSKVGIYVYLGPYTHNVTVRGFNIGKITNMDELHILVQIVERYDAA